MQKGLIKKSTGSWYEVLINDSTIINARLKGVFRLDESKDTNPVAVGDEVTVVNENGDWMISEIAPRKNYIVRASPKHKGARQIIAANIDECFLVATLSNPRTSTGFIDRFLLTAAAYHIPVTIVFNKIDLLDEKNFRKMEDMASVYCNIGYSVLYVSTVTGENIAQLKEKMLDKICLFAGHSGVGKSSLLNTLAPDLNLRTNAISKITGKGMHTTTFAEMLQMPFNAKVIDTPGVKEFGLMHFEPEEISHYFVDFKDFLPQCKFNNCIHENEPDCAVIKAVNNHQINANRYLSYLNILQDYRSEYKYWENR